MNIYTSVEYILLKVLLIIFHLHTEMEVSADMATNRIQTLKANDYFF